MDITTLVNRLTPITREQMPLQPSRHYGWISSEDLTGYFTGMLTSPDQRYCDVYHPARILTIEIHPHVKVLDLLNTQATEIVLVFRGIKKKIHVRCDRSKVHLWVASDLHTEITKGDSPILKPTRKPAIIPVDRNTIFIKSGASDMTWGLFRALRLTYLFSISPPKPINRPLESCSFVEPAEVGDGRIKIWMSSDMLVLMDAKKSVRDLEFGPKYFSIDGTDCDYPPFDHPVESITLMVAETLRRLEIDCTGIKKIHISQDKRSTPLIVNLHGGIGYLDKLTLATSSAIILDAERIEISTIRLQNTTLDLQSSPLNIRSTVRTYLFKEPQIKSFRESITATSIARQYWVPPIDRFQMFQPDIQDSI